MLISLAAMTMLTACPDLSGRYLCDDDGENIELVLKQTAPDTYEYTEGELGPHPVIADGVRRDWPASEYVRDASYAATCPDGKLRLEIHGLLYQGGKPTHSLEFELFYRKTAKDDVVISSRFLGSEDETLFYCRRQR